MKNYLFTFILLAAVNTSAAVPNGCFQQGKIIETGRNLDMAIAGEGWIPLKSENGSLRFTRYGSMGMDKEGFLVHLPSGLPVVQVNGEQIEKINVEKYSTKEFAMNLGHEPGRKAIMTSMSFDSDGKLLAFYSDGQDKVIAQISLAVIQNQRALELVDKDQAVFKGGADIGKVEFAMVTSNATGKVFARSLESQNSFEKACK